MSCTLEEVTGDFAKFIRRMFDDVENFVRRVPHLGNLKEAFDKEIKIWQAANDAIEKELTERSQNKPSITNSSQKELEKYEDDTKKLQKVLINQKESLTNIEGNKARLSTATQSDAMVFTIQNTLKDYQKAQPAPFKIMNALTKHFEENKVDNNNALDALKNIITKSKNKPEEKILTKLLSNITALQTATKELKKITDKMVTPEAGEFYQEQKEFKDAEKKRNELLAMIAAQLQSSKELLNKIFDADDKSAELLTLTKYLRSHNSTSTNPSDMPILGGSNSSSEIKMDLDGTCGIKQYSKDPTTGKWEAKSLMDKNGMPLQPTMKEILAAIAEADKIEQARCAAEIPPKKFKPTKITKDFFGKSYTIEHNTKERRDEYNDVLKNIVENRLTATPLLTQSDTQNEMLAAQPAQIAPTNNTAPQQQPAATPAQPTPTVQPAAASGMMRKGISPSEGAHQDDVEMQSINQQSAT